MNIVFRVDSSFEIGTGHVVRCLTLARQLAKRGVKSIFVCREHNGNLIPLIIKNGFEVIVLCKKPQITRETNSVCNGSQYENWLGDLWFEDAKQIKLALIQRSVDWIIVDHYGIDFRWESYLKRFAKIMVIDDLVDRQHNCDLLLNQNYLPDIASKYKKIVPENCRLLLGTEYAILHAEYAKLHSELNIKSGRVRRVLVYFGGFDLDNVTGKVVSAFVSLNPKNLIVDIVLSSKAHHFKAVASLIENYNYINLHVDLPALADLMAGADLAIGACGSSVWERCCLGLPTLVITVADNQIQIADQLAKAGVIDLLGHQNQISNKIILEKIQFYLNNEFDTKWSVRCKALVDGRGANRVADFLVGIEIGDITIRKVKESDEKVLFDWVNEDSVRNNSFEMREIKEGEHKLWFKKCLNDYDGCRVYIIETIEKNPIGQVRFNKILNSTWEVDFSIDKFFRGKGIGKISLSLAMKYHKQQFPNANFMARVKRENFASQKVFNSLCFSSQEVDNLIEYRYL